MVLLGKFKPLLSKYSCKLAYEDAESELIVFFLELLHRLELTKFQIDTAEYCLLSFISKSVYHEYLRLSK